MPTISFPTAPLKYVVGIDNAKDTFVACFGRIDVRQQLRFGKEAKFDNTPAGFAALLVWTSKQQPLRPRCGWWSRPRACTMKT